MSGAPALALLEYPARPMTGLISPEVAANALGSDGDGKKLAAAFRRGYMLAAANENKKASTAFLRIVKQNKRFASGFFNLGITSYRCGYFETAIQFFQESIRLDPDLSDAAFNLGVVLEKSGDREGAIDAYREAIRINPGFAVAYYNLGVVLSITGEFPAAVNAYTASLELEPGNAHAYHNLGVVLYHSNELDLAIGSLEKARALDSKATNTCLSLGVAYGRRYELRRDVSDLNAAYEAFYTVTQLEPGYAPGYLGLGIAQRMIGQFPAALAAFQSAAQLPLDDHGQVILAGEIKQISIDANRLISETRSLAEKISVLPVVTGDNTSESITAGYNRPAMPTDTLPDLETTLRAAAHHLGRPLATIRAQLGVGDAANATTKRRTKAAHKGGDLDLSPSQVVAVIEDSTLGRLRHRYAALLEKNTDLPDQLNAKQAREAAQLWSTYRALQERLAKVGLKPLEPDSRVSEANRRSVAFYRSRKAQPTKATP